PPFTGSDRNGNGAINRGFPARLAPLKETSVGSPRLTPDGVMSLIWGVAARTEGVATRPRRRARPTALHLMPIASDLIAGPRRPCRGAAGMPTSGGSSRMIRASLTTVYRRRVGDVCQAGGTCRLAEGAWREDLESVPKAAKGARISFRYRPLSRAGLRIPPSG